MLGLVQPEGDGIRVDSALVDGLVVSSDYDPMLAKVIAWGPSRATALRRLRHALADTVTLGVTTNVEFLQLLIDDPDVIAGDLDTDLIARRLDGLAFRAPDARVWSAAALVLHALAAESAGASSWRRPSGWRIGSAAASVYRLGCGDATTTVRVTGMPDAATLAHDDQPGSPASVVLDTAAALGSVASARVTTDGVTTRFRYAVQGSTLHLEQGGVAWSLTDRGFERAAGSTGVETPTLRSPMPGAVVAVFAADGSRVEAGDPVLSIEAMKMEHVLRAPHAGTVRLGVELGTQVAADQVVATIDADTKSPKQMPSKRPSSNRDRRGVQPMTEKRIVQRGLYFEEFEEDVVYVHSPGRTVTETDNVLFTTLTMNTQALHLDAEWSSHTEFGERLINSMFTLATMVGVIRDAAHPGHHRGEPRFHRRVVSAPAHGGRHHDERDPPRVEAAQFEPAGARASCNSNTPLSTSTATSSRERMRSVLMLCRPVEETA